MFENKEKTFSLQMFADGQAGAEGEGATGQAAEGMLATSAKGDKNPLANVKYGIQPEDAQNADVQKAVEGEQNKQALDRNAMFENLIKGEYKDLYDQRVKDTVQKRLKNTKETVDRYNELTPTIEMLARKYGVDGKDIQALNKAIEDDDAYYEEEAIEKGVTVEQLKSIKKMERENATLKKQMQEHEKSVQIEKDIANWMEQAKDASKMFPSLDLGEELKNEQFINLLRSGISVENAYFAMHHRELVPKAMEYTAKKVEKQVANKIIANGSRPSENGLNSSSTAVVKRDVKSLTKADRDEIIRRVGLGEKISF